MNLLRVAAAAAVLVPFVAAAEPYRCEARGGPAWREYRTAHFLVATDLSASRAEAVLRNLEQLHALVLQALVGDGVEIPGKVRVVAFADPRDYDRYAPDETSGYFRHGPLLTPTMAFPSEGFQADPIIVAREIAHHVSWYLFPRQPSWFSYGLARFVDTVAETRGESAPATGSHMVRGRGTGRWAGLVRPDLRSWLQEWGSGPPADLLTYSRDLAPSERTRYQAWSWLLYHWMWNARPKAFTEFTSRLSNAADPEAAWRECFPDLDPSKPQGGKALAGELERYLRSGRFASYEVKAAPFDARFTVTPLAPAEVHMLLRQARMRPQEKEEEAAEVAEALREDPLHPIAASYAADGSGQRLRAALRKTTAARPDDWRAWYLLAGTFGEEGERAEKEATLRKALALAPESASVRNDLAWLLLRAGRAKEALPHANAAADLAPWSPSVIDTLAGVAAELRKCAEARALEARAIDLLARTDPARAAYQKHLDEIEARCAPPAAAARP